MFAWSHLQDRFPLLELWLENEKFWAKFLRSKFDCQTCSDGVWQQKNKLGLRQEPCEFVMFLCVPTPSLMVWALFCLVFIRDSSYVHFSLVQPLFERPHLICKCVFRCLITSFAPWIHLTSIACTIKCFHLTPCLVFILIGLRTKWSGTGSYFILTITVQLSSINFNDFLT